MPEGGDGLRLAGHQPAQAAPRRPKPTATQVKNKKSGTKRPNQTILHQIDREIFCFYPWGIELRT